MQNHLDLKLFTMYFFGLKNIEFNMSPVYDDRYIKSKIKTYGDNICTNFSGLNVSEVKIVYENKYY